MDFAVKVEGLDEEGQAHWVLDVDPAGERFLIGHEDKSLHWVPMDKCKFVKVSSPDTPRLVMLVQPSQPTQLAVPNLTEMRRAQ